jgi:hypothetical protein
LLNYFVVCQNKIFKLTVLGLGLAGVLVSLTAGLLSTARLDKLYESIWLPLTANEIAMIKQSVAGTRPVQARMTIQYPDPNARDLALSFQQLFSEVGFNPEMKRDILQSGVSTIRIEPDDNDVEMLQTMIKSIENITKGRIRWELTDSRGRGQTRIFIGQKGT